MADYSLGSAPLTLQQQLQALQIPALSPNLGQMTPIDYSFGQQSAMPIAGMGGGQGLQYGGMNTWGQGAAGGNSFGSGFGMNMPSFALGLQGLNSLGSLYMGAKSLGLANKQFDSAQKFANINLRNQTQVYNDTLENKLRRIGSFNETPKDQTEAEIARRKLPAYA